MVSRGMLVASVLFFLCFLFTMNPLWLLMAALLVTGSLGFKE